MGMSQSVVSPAYARFNATQSYDRRPGQGRRRITTERDDRAIIREARRNPTAHAHTIVHQFRNRRQRPPQQHISASTVEENEDSAVNTNSDASSYFDELGQESNIAHLQKKKKLSPKKKPKCALRMDAPKMDPPVLQAVNRLETLAQAIRQD
ncbi:unnamed protein product [Euphydryas editha]|uniref:Uncharacterized protein n=1 Tax=Euphydryas editha TaxID=104508 RepID=A0AAU9UWB7_EUPED|nr:unnamed protein product [Euphydryas editha]